MTQSRNHFSEILSSAIDAVRPASIFKNKISFRSNLLLIDNKEYNLHNYDNIFVVGAGKASGFMAYELEKMLGDKITCGVVSVKYGYSADCKIVKEIEAGHPIIDENSLKAGDEITKTCESAGHNDLVICLLSGGGSALFEKLPDGISLTDMQRINQLLLECGATIDEINTVRKNLSLVKGGKLLRYIYPAACVSLIISDVIGNQIEFIASGPTCENKSSPRDVLGVINKYKLNSKFPKNVLDYLHNLSTVMISDESENYSMCENIILASNKDALMAALQKAEWIGYNTFVANDPITGEANVRGKEFAGLVKNIYNTGQPVKKPACVIAGGETTVTIQGHGKGGRNQEFVLAALNELKNFNKPFLLASCGTDGTDGPTDAAGAVIDHSTFAKVKSQSLEIEHYLANNDAYSFFKQINELIITGPTGTNVMDIAFIIVP